MADNHSFDVVSEVDHVEMHNAIQQTQHEIAVRYDFKGTHASLDFDKKANTITILADHESQLDAILLVLRERMARRKVPLNALKRGKVEEASHDTVREVVGLHSGIDPDTARKMVKDIKGLGLKVQAQIMDNRLRVMGKKKDDLQSVMAFLREKGPDIPLQFTNYT